MASRKDNKGRVLRTGESQRKDGTYQYRYTDVYGKRRCEYAKTLNDLRIKEEEITKTLIEGLSPYSQSMTFDDLFGLFLKMKKGQIRNTSMATYENMRKMVQKYPISRLPIVSIKQTTLKEWLFGMLEDGYSQGTVRSLKHVLHGVFDLAVSDDILRKNPCTFKLFFKEKEPTKKYALTLQQQKQLLDYIKVSDRFSSYYDIVLILMGTGMRISELLGLTIGDVDFRRNRIHVGHQLFKETGGRIVVSVPKSEKGNRYIPMTSEVRASLKRVITTRSVPQELMIDGYYGFLFVNPSTGIPYTRAAIRYVLNELIDEHNGCNKQQLPHLSPHIFRHTFASTMIQSGVDAKTLQHILGHANISTTLDTYTHMFEDAIVSAMEKAEDFISASR